MKKLPDYIIIGDIRCGTTSLYEMMIQHPQIVPASTKELYFFNHFGKDDNWDKGIEWYMSKLGDCKKGQIIGEATPEYMWKYNIVPQRIKQVCPNVKLIVILRNPVNKIYSHFALYTRTELRHNRIPINKISKYYLDRATYVNQLKEWFKYFPRKQFMIIKSEDMFKNPQKTLNEIFSFLNLSFYKVNPLHRNRARYSPMKPALKEKLNKYFEPYNKELYKLIGKNFNWKVTK